MTTNRRMSACIAIAASSALLLAGCTSGGQQGDDDPTAAEGGTITFSGQTQEQALWEEVFAAFEEANPGWTVEASYSPNDSYPQLVQTQLQSGQAADVIQSTPGSGGPLAALTLAAGDRLATLTDSPWVDDVPETMRDLITLDGEVYAYPTDLAPFFVAYNVDLFEQAGAEVPSTFDDLLDTCGTIADAGIIPIALAGASYQNVTITLQSLAGNNVFGPDPEWNQQRSDGETTFEDTDGWHEVLADFQSMVDAGCYAPDVAGVNAPVHSQQFASGQAAMYVMPAQALAIVASSGGENLDISSFPFPGETADTTWVPANSGISLVVNADADEIEGARLLVDFLGEAANRVMYSEHAGTIAYAAGSNGEDVIPEVLEPLRSHLEGGRSITLDYLLWPSGAVNQQLATSAQGLFTGQKTIDEVLADADRAWEDAEQ